MLPLYSGCSVPAAGPRAGGFSCALAAGDQLLLPFVSLERAAEDREETARSGRC